MTIIDLGTYAQARALCEGSRYALKGRRIDSYTVIALRSEGTEDEHIIFAHRSWTPKGQPPKPLTEFARYTPNGNITGRLQSFTKHQLDQLFSVWITKSKHNYNVLKDIEGREAMLSDPIVLGMNDAGTRARIIVGTPCPDLVRDSTKSTEWSRDKRDFDAAFKCALMVGAHQEIYTNQQHPDYGRWVARQKMKAENFVSIVRACDTEAMVLFLLPMLRHRTSTFDDVLEIYRLHYQRHRRDILVAAGARVKAD